MEGNKLRVVRLTKQTHASIVLNLWNGVEYLVDCSYEVAEAY